MLEFAAAAAASEVDENEDIVEVNLFGLNVEARRLTTAQTALISAARAQGGGEQVNAIFGAIQDMFGTEALAHVKRLIHDRRIDLGDLLGGGTELNPDHGVVDAVIAAFSAGRPTRPSTASSSSRATAGPRSTGRSPGKGSTRSASPSTRS